MSKEIIERSKSNPLWKAYGGITISGKELLDIQLITSHIKVLTKKETSKIVNAFNGEMYDMGIEYAWHRAMKKLDNRLENFGLDFISEMVGYDSIDSIDSISKKEKINLAFELGMIDSTAKIKLSQANELINHFMDEKIDSEMNLIESLDIIVNLTQYILGNNIDVNSIEFKSFREDLQSKVFTSDNVEVELLETSPYFFIKTTIRTILNLIKTSKDAQKSIVLNNAIIFIEKLWNNLFVEDRKHIGTTYAVAINDGDKDVFKTFSTILDKVQGYDYVPETTRSNAFKKVAKAYISVHYAMNNFYNEEAYAKKLNNMGTIIPDFALNECLEAVIISYIGNSYGVANSAQVYNNKILKKITYEQWKEFFSQLLIQNQNILEDISRSSENMINRWFDLVENYVSKDFTIKDPLSSNIYKNSISKNVKVRSLTKIGLKKITG